MDPITIAAIAGFGIQAVASIVGYFLGQGDRDTARRLMDEASRQYPEQVPQLERMVAEKVPASAMASLNTAPEQAAQREALAGLGRVANQGADNIEFRGAAAAAEQQAAQARRAANASVLQQMQARGMGGSGMEFAARQQAASDSANSAAAQGFQGAAEGRRQALSALQGYGQMAGQMRGQSAQEQEARARAADEVERFNAMGRERTQAYNLALPQQDFGNRMALGGARAGALTRQAGYLSGQAGQTADAWSQIGQGASQAANAIGNQQSEEEYMRLLRGAGGRP